MYKHNVASPRYVTGKESSILITFQICLDMLLELFFDTTVKLNKRVFLKKLVATMPSKIKSVNVGYSVTFKIYCSVLHMEWIFTPM